MLTESSQPRRIGRYLLYGPIASGGMATVHFGRLVGEAGFSRTVAIKRLHPQLLDAPEIAASLLDEARLVSRIQHPNVVATLDLLEAEDEVFLVMDYVRGESLARLLAAARARREQLPLGLVAGILCGVLHGLHAAHEAHGESGEPLGIVHRDVSPENVLVGADGVARLLDFGIAKARGRLTTTRGGQLKGKIPYMAPEQLLFGDVTRRTDVYAAGIVLWEALTLRRLFQGNDEGAMVTEALEAPILPPSALSPGVSAELDAVVLKALERNAEGRYATARAFAVALEEAASLATPRELGEWVEQAAGAVLTKRDARVASIERASAAPASARTPSSRRWAPAEPTQVAGRATEPTQVAGRATEPTQVAAEPTQVEISAEPTQVEVSAEPTQVEVSTQPTQVAARATEPDVIRPDAPAARSAPGRPRPLVVSIGPAASPGTAESPRPLAAPSRRAGGAVLVGALLLGGGGAFAFLRSEPRQLAPVPPTPMVDASPGAPASAVAPSPAGPSAPSLATSNPQTSSATGPSPSPAPVGLVAPSERADASPARSLPAAGGARTPASRSAASRAAPAGADPRRCQPPYTVDKTGLRRLKPECL